MIRTLVIDENPVLRLGVLTLLNNRPEIELVGAAVNGQSNVEMLQRHRPHVVVFGCTSPSADGIRTLVQEDPGTRIIVLTSTAEPAALLRALSAGAGSCIMHGHFEPDELAEMVVATARGESVLSPPVVNALVAWLNAGGGGNWPQHQRGLTVREMEIMELIFMGLNNRRIASRLAISEKTVKNHVHSIYKRLGANGRDHAIECWRELSPDNQQI